MRTYTAIVALPYGAPLERDVIDVEAASPEHAAELVRAELHAWRMDTWQIRELREAA
jgi:hypothetical protein